MLGWNNLPKDHRNATSRKLRKDRLRLLIKFRGDTVYDFLKWMPYKFTSFVVFDPDRIGPLFVSVIRPSQVTGDDIFGTLQPLIANNRRSGRLWPSSLNTSVGELIYLLAADGGLFPFNTTFTSHAFPRVRNASVEFFRIQSMHNIPGAAAKGDDLFPLTKPLTP